MLSQIEACLNSRPLAALPCAEDGGVDALTPGHFLVGRPLEALPNPAASYSPLLKRWHLCQALLQQFWKRWSTEYLVGLQKMYKLCIPSERSKISVGDVVVLREDGTIWTMAPGKSHSNAPWQGWGGSCCDDQVWQRQHLHSTRYENCSYFSYLEDCKSWPAVC